MVIFFDLRSVDQMAQDASGNVLDELAASLNHPLLEAVMESSFKKSYEKTLNPDGSYQLSFKSKRLNPLKAASVGSLIALVCLPVSCAVTSPIMLLSKTSGVPLWLAVSLVLYGFVLFRVANTHTTIKVLPNVGLQFGGKSLPFKEIQNLGFIHTPTLGNAKGSAYVYAETHGTQANISKFITPSLAESLVADIKESSGVVWS